MRGQGQEVGRREKEKKDKDSPEITGVLGAEEDFEGGRGGEDGK